MTYIIAILAIIGGGLLLANRAQAASPSDFADSVDSILSNVGTNGISHELIIAQAHLETAGGTSKDYLYANNLFGIHAVGSPNPYWSGASYQPSPGSETVRKYASKEQCVRDYLRLLNAKYPNAVTAGQRGDAAAFFNALHAGGYDGAAYDTELASRYRSLYGALA